jgi:hypothetical protein
VHPLKESWLCLPCKGLLRCFYNANFVVRTSVDSAGAVPLFTLLPALLVTFLFALAAVYRSPLLHLAGILYAFAGVLFSLTSSSG